MSCHHWIDRFNVGKVKKVRCLERIASAVRYWFPRVFDDKDWVVSEMVKWGMCCRAHCSGGDVDEECRK